MTQPTPNRLLLSRRELFAAGATIAGGIALSGYRRTRGHRRNYRATWPT
jgi:hypothetical protein